MYKIDIVTFDSRGTWHNWLWSSRLRWIYLFWRWMVLTFYNYDFVENKNYFNLDNDLLHTHTRTRARMWSCPQLHQLRDVIQRVTTAATSFCSFGSAFVYVSLSRSLHFFTSNRLKIDDSVDFSFRNKNYKYVQHVKRWCEQWKHWTHARSFSSFLLWILLLFWGWGESERGR